MPHLQSIAGVSRACAVAMLVVLANCIPSAAQAQAIDPGTVEIRIDNFTFTPQEVTIAPGTTVRWVNHDDIPHTVVEAARSFKSKTLDTEDSFEMTFTSPGNFSYFCSLHPHMTGKVVVKAGS